MKTAVLHSASSQKYQLEVMVCVSHLVLEGINSELNDEGNMQYLSPIKQMGQERLIQSASGLLNMRLSTCPTEKACSGEAICIFLRREALLDFSLVKSLSL